MPSVEPDLKPTYPTQRPKNVPFPKAHLFNPKRQRRATVPGSVNETPDNLAPAPETSEFAAGFGFLKNSSAWARIYSSNAAVLGAGRPAPMQVRMFVAQQAGNPRWRSECSEPCGEGPGAFPVECDSITRLRG